MRGRSWLEGGWSEEWCNLVNRQYQATVVVESREIEIGCWDFAERVVRIAELGLEREWEWWQVQDAGNRREADLVTRIEISEFCDVKLLQIAEKRVECWNESERCDRTKCKKLGSQFLIQPSSFFSEFLRLLLCQSIHQE